MKRLLARVLSFVMRSRVEAFTVFGRTIWLIPGAEIAARYANIEDGLRAVATLARHEAEHAGQQRREPIAFYCKYVWFLLRYGYKSNPYEASARRAAGEEE